MGGRSKIGIGEDPRPESPRTTMTRRWADDPGSASAKILLWDD